MDITVDFVFVPKVKAEDLAAKVRSIRTHLESNPDVLRKVVVDAIEMVSGLENDAQVLSVPLTVDVRT